MTTLELSSSLTSIPVPTGLGFLSVTTTLAGAFIFIDGIQRGASPATIYGLTPGDHSLLLKLDSFMNLFIPVTNTAGEIQSYTTELSPTAGVVIHPTATISARTP